LKLIEAEIGLTPDQLFALVDVLKNKHSVDQKEYAKRLIDSALFFNVADMDPNEFYDQQKK